MNTIFMNSRNSKTSDHHRLLVNFTNKIIIKRKDKLYMEKYKMSYKNNKFKISAPICHEEFELPDRSYSQSDIQDYSNIHYKSLRKRQLILQ